MALKLNCILNQPSALPDLIKLVEKTAHKLNLNKRSAKVEDVYREIREMGVEIDAESIALAYSNVAGILNRKNFSTQADVNRFGGESLKRAIRIANEGDLVISKAGKATVSRTVASGIAKTFSTLEGVNDVDKSRLIQLQDLLRRAANSLLDKSAYPTRQKTSFTDVLQQAFDVENISKTGAEAMNGKIKASFENIDTIWNSIQDDINQIAGNIKDKAQRARFMQLTDAIRQSSYDLLLGSKQADFVIKEILKEARYTKRVTLNGQPKEVVDWNKALSSKDDWRNDFGLVLRRNGFDVIQTRRIIDRLEGNYQKAIQKQAENKLNQVNKSAGNTSPIDKDAIRRLIALKNAGVFLPNNQATLAKALGYDVPQDVADNLSAVLDDYEANMNNGFAEISNVYKEEVKRKISNLLSPLNKSKFERMIGRLEDYFGLRASNTISTLLNTVQNVTSGINNTMIPAIVAIARTRNPKLVASFIKQWVDTIRDVSAGGVSPRDSKTVNVNQFENRGGLSDRWTFDNAKGFMGHFKAVVNILGQVTATAVDAANGTVIYDIEMIAAARDILIRREGKSGSEANKIIDDIIFGNHSSGVSSRQFWEEQATKILENQEGVIDRATKARRVASELKWNELTKYGLSVDEIKRMMSVSLDQKGRNLGHRADVMASPNIALDAMNKGIAASAASAKQKGDRRLYLLTHFSGSILRAVNMFVGGRMNWAMLTLQNSPVGVGISLVDFIYTEAEAYYSKRVPLYRQQLTKDDAATFEEQIRQRKAMASRLERAIVGTAIQAIGYVGFMALMGAADDDDRKKYIKDAFTEYMQDPKTRRLMDKAAPMLLAAELQYAWDKDKGKFIDNRIGESLLLPHYLTNFDVIGYYVSNIKASTGLDNLQNNLTYAKRKGSQEARDNASSEAWASYVGSMLQLPYTAWWNIEQDEVKLFQNGLQPNPEDAAIQKRDHKIQRENIDGWMDAFINGAFSSDIVQGKHPSR